MKGASASCGSLIERLPSSWAAGWLEAACTCKPVPHPALSLRPARSSGFMSNRGRQNVASFLALDLGLDWRWGADWFESLLLDYDVCRQAAGWC